MSRRRTVPEGVGLPQYMTPRPPGPGGKNVTYRMHLPDGTRMTLGTDRAIALQRFFAATTPAPAGPIDHPRDLWARHRKGAARRGIEFALDVEQIRALLAAQRDRCAVTSLPFSMDKPKGLRIRPWAPSLDRIKRGGYVTGNVRIVCAFVNVAMNGFGDSLYAAVLRPLIDAEVRVALMRLGLPHIPEDGIFDRSGIPAANDPSIPKAENSL